MYAFEIPGARFSLPAGGAVALHRFVTVDAAGAKQGTASTSIIGASMNEVTAEEFGQNERIVEIADGIVIVEAGAAVAAGDKISCDAQGRAIKATGESCGVAITAATAAGQLITVKM